MQSDRTRNNNRPNRGKTRPHRRFGLKTIFTGCAVVLVGAMTVYLFIATGSADGAREWARQRLVGLAATGGYRLDRLYVEGRRYTDPDILRGILNMKRGDPLFAFDPDTARELLMKVSWIKDANVRRELPGTIYISLVERQPMALWQHEGKVRVIDADGVALTRDLRPFTKLPLVVGAGANTRAAELLSLLSAEPMLRDRVDAATWIGERRWDLSVRGGMVVKLPEDDVGLAIKKLADSQSRDQILDKDIVMIDLREPDRLVVRTRPGTVMEQPVNFVPPAGGKEL